MAATKVSPNPIEIETAARPRRLSALDVTILVALAIVVLIDGTSMVIVGSVIPPLVIFGSLYLISAGVVATGWRWAPLFPVIFCTLGVIGEQSTGYPAYVYTHPGSNNIALTSFIINYPLLLLTIGCGVAKLVQTLRHEMPHAPGWLTLARGLAAGCIIGGILIGASIPAGGGSGGSSSTGGTAGTKTVHLESNTFSPDIVALHAGDTLTLVGDAPVPHTIVNGTWDASKHAVPGVEPGAPSVNNVEVNNNSVAIGPFSTPGTYHVFCTVHPGMSLTIIVQ